MQRNIWLVLGLATSRPSTAFLPEHLSAAARTPRLRVAMQEDGVRRDVNRRRKRRQGSSSDDIMRAAGARWAENEAAGPPEQTVKPVTDENFAALEALLKPSPKAPVPLRGGRRRSLEREEARQNVSDAVTRWEGSLEARNGRPTKESVDTEAAERRADEQRAALHAAMKKRADETEAEALDALNAMMVTSGSDTEAETLDALNAMMMDTSESDVSS
tara:strand:+ start:107 stop:757 length:651 start_codon:yes stop_codon:yes gene_type:complete